MARHGARVLCCFLVLFGAGNVKSTKKHKKHQNAQRLWGRGKRSTQGNVKSTKMPKKHEKARRLWPGGGEEVNAKEMYRAPKSTEMWGSGGGRHRGNV